MGSHKKEVTEVRFNVSEDSTEAFSKFNIIRIVKGLDKETAFAELVLAEVARHEKTILAHQWMKWDDFEMAMLKAGFTVNRQTIWNYRGKGERQVKGYEVFNRAVKSDRIDTLYAFDLILAFFKGEDGNVGLNN